MNIDIALLTDNAIKLLTAIQSNPFAAMVVLIAFAMWMHWSKNKK
jgi:hypothetical protein